MAEGLSPTMPFDVGDEEGGGGAVSVASVELAAIFSWVNKVPVRETESLALKFFSYEQLKQAANYVKPYAECSIPHGEQSEQLCRNVVKAVKSISDQDEPGVKFFVSAKDLMFLPGFEATLVPMDTGAVGARLLNMEAAVEKVSDSLEQVSKLEQAVQVLTTVVTKLQEKESARPEVQLLSQQRLFSDVVTEGLQADGKRKRGTGSPTSPQQEVPKRPQPVTPPSLMFQRALDANGKGGVLPVPGLSQMLKEQRQEAESGFTEVFGRKKRRQRKQELVKGSSEVEAGGGLPAPFSVFIRNTDPNYTEGDIKKYLEQCAAALPEEEKLSSELKVLQVNHIPIKRGEGAPVRSKCWKVTVSPEFREHMLSPKAYPSTWYARKWHSNGVESRTEGEKEAGNQGSKTGSTSSLMVVA